MITSTPFSDYIERHEAYLNQILIDEAVSIERLREAIYYVLFPGGKRLRPLLVYLSGELLNVPLSCLDIISASIELIHTYSLIHDDLPAMDNDDMRRGKDSCHRAFGEASAILTGDALQTLAFDILLHYLPNHIPASQVIEVTRILTQASGASGMIGGQWLDLEELHQSHITLEQVSHIHQLKTGRLITACLTMPIRASKQSASDARIPTGLQTYAQHLGLVFQMQDDYLDAYGTKKISGKNRSSDQANNKLTYAAFFSQEDLLKEIDQHYQLAYNALETITQPHHVLYQLTQMLHQRTSLISMSHHV